MFLSARGAGILAAALLLASGARAQEVIHNDENLASSRTEAWAMNYMAASTFMTAFGQTPVLAPWHWIGAAEIGHIPRLSGAEQRVGFAGTKQEDLNRSPVFGRARVMLGLPAGFVAELGYTPPLELRGTRARDLFALAIGRRVFEHENLTVSLRAFGQHGRASGDITCPARLADAPLADNPYGCRGASDDQLVLDYYGADATAAWNARPWSFYATAGFARTDLEVHVDALTLEVRDRSTLAASATKPYVAVGASRDLDRCWKIGAEILYVPLRVQRELSGASTNDPFTSLRLQLSYRFG